MTMTDDERILAADRLLIDCRRFLTGSSPGTCLQLVGKIDQYLRQHTLYLEGLAPVPPDWVCLKCGGTERRVRWSMMMGKEVLRITCAQCGHHSYDHCKDSPCPASKSTP